MIFLPHFELALVFVCPASTHRPSCAFDNRPTAEAACVLADDPHDSRPLVRCSGGNAIDPRFVPAFWAFVPLGAWHLDGPVRRPMNPPPGHARAGAVIGWRAQSSGLRAVGVTGVRTEPSPRSGTCL